MWIGLCARSPAAKLKWKMRTGIAIKSHSNTRWWSYWEVLDQLLSQFADVEPFLENLGVAPAYARNLLSILHDADRLATLKIQLAVTIDAGRIFVSKTYLMEGDGDIIVDAYNHLQELCTAAAEVSYPNTKAVTIQLANSDVEAARQFENAKAYARPTLQYSQRRFNHLEATFSESVLHSRLCECSVPKGHFS